MGRQAKLKAARRAIRQRRKLEQSTKMAKHLVTPVESPPDLGVSVQDGIKANDKFGG